MRSRYTVSAAIKSIRSENDRITRKRFDFHGRRKQRSRASRRFLRGIRYRRDVRSNASRRISVGLWCTCSSRRRIDEVKHDARNIYTSTFISGTATRVEKKTIRTDPPGPDRPLGQNPLWGSVTRWRVCSSYVGKDTHVGRGTARGIGHSTVRRETTRVQDRFG